MAKVSCTLKEFTFFIDPRVRINITSLTKQLKSNLDSKCQKCDEKKELDAAHKHGRSRPDIIKEILEKYKKNDGTYEINDLQKVLDEINDAHKPIENHFLFLCKKCHREYDSWVRNLTEIKSEDSSTKIKTKNSEKTPKIQSNTKPDLNEILCKNETQSWKYKLGWTSIQNRKNIEQLISKIESSFNCNPLAFKSWYFHKRKDNDKQFSGIMCNKENSVICFRIEPGSFNINDKRIIRNKRWFFPVGKEARIKIIPQNFDLIMQCLSYAYDFSL